MSMTTGATLIEIVLHLENLLAILLADIHAMEPLATMVAL
jgi:hypothetical protein